MLIPNSTINNAPWTISHMRIGPDVLKFSATSLTFPTPLLRLPLMIGGQFILKIIKRSKHPHYKWMGQYRHTKTGVFLDILYQPVEDYHPWFHVSFRSTIRDLLDINLVEKIVMRLERFHNVELSVAFVEMAFDHPTHIEDAVAEYFYAGRTKTARGRYQDTPKVEDEVSIARLEVRFTRRWLHRWKVQTITDLRGIDWGIACARYLTFEYYKNQRDRLRSRECFTSIHRQKYRRKGRPHPTIHPMAQVAMARFMDELQKGVPFFYGQETETHQEGPQRFWPTAASGHGEGVRTLVGGSDEYP